MGKVNDSGMKIVITRGAQIAIRTLLAQAGWAETPLDIYLAGNLMKQIPALTFQARQGESPADQKVRVQSEFTVESELEISHEQVGVVEKAVKVAIAAKRHGVTPDLFEIIEKLELYGKP